MAMELLCRPTFQFRALHLLEANLVPGSARFGPRPKSYTTRCAYGMEMARLVLIAAILALIMEITVEEVRVTSWNDLNEQLYAEAWQPSLGRYRSPMVFRGLPVAGYPLTSS